MSGVALITGSGRGIGAATAKFAAKRGYAVCVNHLKNEERAEECAEAILWLMSGEAACMIGNIPTLTGGR